MPNPISYDDDSNTQGIYSRLTTPVVEKLSSISDPVEQIDVPIETSPGVDGAALRVRIRKTNEETTKILQRARNALKRYIRNEGQRRECLLNGFFEQAETARATAIQAALLARDS